MNYKILKEVEIDGVKHMVNDHVEMSPEDAKHLVEEGMIEASK